MSKYRFGCDGEELWVENDEICYCNLIHYHQLSEEEKNDRREYYVFNYKDDLIDYLTQKELINNT